MGYLTIMVENRANILYQLILLILAQWPFCLFLAPHFLCFLLFNGVSIVLGSCATDFRKLTSLPLIQVRSCSCHCIPFPSTSMTGFCLCRFIRPFSHSTSLVPPPYLGIIYLILFVTYIVVFLLMFSLLSCTLFARKKTPCLPDCKMIAAVELLPTQGPS